MYKIVFEYIPPRYKPKPTDKIRFLAQEPTKRDWPFPDFWAEKKGRAPWKDPK